MLRQVRPTFDITAAGSPYSQPGSFYSMTPAGLPHDQLNRLKGKGKAGEDEITPVVISGLYSAAAVRPRPLGPPILHFPTQTLPNDNVLPRHMKSLGSSSLANGVASSSQSGPALAGSSQQDISPLTAAPKAVVRWSNPRSTTANQIAILDDSNARNRQTQRLRVDRPESTPGAGETSAASNSPIEVRTIKARTNIMGRLMAKFSSKKISSNTASELHPNRARYQNRITTVRTPYEDHSEGVEELDSGVVYELATTEAAGELASAVVANSANSDQPTLSINIPEQSTTKRSAHSLPRPSIEPQENKSSLRINADANDQGIAQDTEQQTAPNVK